MPILKAAQKDLPEETKESHNTSSASISDIKSTYSLLDPTNFPSVYKFPKLMNELNDPNA